VKEDLVVSRVGEGRPGGIQGGCFPFRLKEDQLRLGVRIREGDSTLDSEILRYCSGTGRGDGGTGATKGTSTPGGGGTGA
ncbi:hypothetical protein Taro_026821, partial [Colocasia esculenta]|nr:hypothetical protein [Colocasia esculenta]